MSDIPSPFDTGWFEDEEALGRLVVGTNTAELVAIYRSLLRADIAGLRAGAVASSVELARGADHERALFAIRDALQNDELRAWIEADATRRARIEALTLRITQKDPSTSHNARSLPVFQAFKNWADYAYPLVIVPGYTPFDLKEGKPGVHSVCRERLDEAVADFRAKIAPFILVSGANVYPRGTPYYEAVEMKKVLVTLGVPEERILVEARARHSTTNLRNAGRIMLKHGLSRAVIATKGGGIKGSNLFDQDFYFSNPTISTFHLRCEKELGYRVGVLTDAGENRTRFEPAMAVTRILWRDPLDP